MHHILTSIDSLVVSTAAGAGAAGVSVVTAGVGSIGLATAAAGAAVL